MPRDREAGDAHDLHLHGGEWDPFRTVRLRRVVSGASTLTMQLVRMREPRPRTFGSKLKEAFRSIQIELHHSKKEILVAYLEYMP